MKILSLEAENVKRLRAVSITFKDGLMVIGGANGAGKSSCLDAIAMALGGQKLVCDQPLRKGQQKGHVTIELGEPEPKYRVTRRFGLKGTTSLVIEATDGTRPASPQSLLDGLLGALSFDPLSFSRMIPQRQAETLRQLVGLDTTEIDRKILAAENARTDVGREVKRLEGALAQAVHHPDAPDAEVSIAALGQELSEATETINRAEKMDSQAEDLETDAVTWAGDIEEIDRKIAGLQSEKKRLADQAAKARQEAARIRAKMEAIALPDVAAIRARLNTADTLNRRFRDNAARAKLADDVKAKRRAHEEAERKLEALRDGRRKAIETAPFPIEGLAMDETGVVYKGLPFSQASDAEQLRVSVAMGFAMNPKLKVLLIRNGSLLDDKSMALVSEMAEAAGAQILMERVGKDSHTSVVIEDGMVAAGEGPEAVEVAS